MRKSLIAASLLSAVVTAPALAADSPHTVSGNLTIATDYRFRGVSQTYLGPTVQGGIDYSHSSGLYLGNWNSNVSTLVYQNGSGIEQDFYGGFKFPAGPVGLDFGYIYYAYPNAEVNGTTSGKASFTNQEVYVGASWKWFTAKYSFAVSDYFGLNDKQAGAGYWGGKDGTGPVLPASGDSKGSTYLDLGVSYAVTDKLTLVGHYGHVDVKNYNALSYSDYKLGATYDFKGWLLGASYITTDADADYYYTSNGMRIKDIAKGTVVLSVGKTF